ncbi:flippase [Cohnella massiliensis]|uniref:flippase n=1 Tax=Cohnella massiliensis TaxID=1816691 RepID=UPI0009BAA642|nr:flippase [Cohnella massiliensis]
MNKLTSNFFYNLLYQFLILALPLVVMPYISRVIGPEGIGVNAYSSSVVQIFALFATLGINIYGNRQIAMTKQDGENTLSRNFWDIYSIQLLNSLLVMALYFIFVVFFVNQDKSIFILQSLVLLSSMLDISWLFFGLEEPKKVIIRNTVVRIVSLAFIFVFVNSENDLEIYILISVLSGLVGQLIMWAQAFKYINFPSISLIHPIRHLRPLIYIFFPQLIIQIYVILDRVILGTVANEVEVGFYDQAIRILKVSLAVVTSLTTIMLPRIASEYSQGNIEKIKHYSYRIVSFILFLTLPMASGIAGLASNFTLWFFGPGYEKVGQLMIIMCPIIVLIGLSNVFGMQILVPTQNQKKLTISVSVGAFASIVVSFLLVNRIESIGTAVATIAAELVVTILLSVYVKDFIPFNAYFKLILKYGFLSVIMGLIVYLIGLGIDKRTIMTTIIQVIVGLLFYCFCLLILKDKILFNIYKKIRSLRG